MLRKGLIERFRFGPGPFAGRLAVGGGLRAWTGGFLLSSQNSRCVDGPGGHACSYDFFVWRMARRGFISVLMDQGGTSCR